MAKKVSKKKLTKREKEERNCITCKYNDQDRRKKPCTKCSNYNLWVLHPSVQIAIDKGLVPGFSITEPKNQTFIDEKLIAKLRETLRMIINYDSTNGIENEEQISSMSISDVIYAIRWNTENIPVRMIRIIDEDEKNSGLTRQIGQIYNHHNISELSKRVSNMKSEIKDLQIKVNKVIETSEEIVENKKVVDALRVLSEFDEKEARRRFEKNNSMFGCYPFHPFLMLGKRF